MIKNKDFKFKVSLSEDAYTDNIIAAAMTGSSKDKSIRQIRKQYGKDSRRGTKFYRKELTPKEFLNKAIIGHTFCNCFNLKNGFTPVKKETSNFEFSNIFCIDIDKTKYKSVKSFINKLTYKPTLWYTSYNHKKIKNNEPKSIRFHLIYIIEEQITNVIIYRYITRLLNKQIETDTNEIISDKTNDQAARYFKGTCFTNPDLIKPEKGITYLIYSLKDFIGNTNINDFIKFIDNNADYSKSYLNDKINYTNQNKKRLINDLNKIKIYISSLNNNTPILYSNEKKNTLENELIFNDLEKNNRNVFYCSYNFVQEMERLSYENFMKINSRNYKYFYRTEKDIWIDNLYQYTDDDYLCLPYMYKIKHDGSKRRKSIFLRTCLRRLIKPNADANTLLFNAYIDVHRFYDNSDNALNVKCLEHNVNQAIYYTIDELKEIITKYSETIIQDAKNRRPKSKIIFKPGTKTKDIKKIIKEQKYNFIDDYYDENLSVEENRLIISENLFPISKDTLYRYIKNRNKKIQGKLTNTEIYNLIDINYSFRKNRTILRNSNIKISDKTLRELYKMKKDNINLLNQQIDNQNKIIPDFNTNLIDKLNLNDISLPDFTNVSDDDLTLPDIQVKFTSNTNTDKTDKEPIKDLNENNLFHKLDLDLDF